MERQPAYISQRAVISDRLRLSIGAKLLTVGCHWPSACQPFAGSDDFQIKLVGLKAAGGRIDHDPARVIQLSAPDVEG